MRSGMDLAIVNGRIVSPTGITSAALGIHQGKIVAIASGEYLPHADATIDAAGRHVLPGVLDVHCHEDFPPSPPFAPWSLIAKTESKAAALGGVTTMGFFTRPFEGEDIAEALDVYRSTWEENAVLDCVFHMMVVNEARKNGMGKLASDHGITSFKFLVGYKGPQAAVQGSPGLDDGFIFDGLRRVAQLKKQGWPALAMVHAENADIIPLLRKEVAGRYDVRAWHDSRPNFVEAECMSRFVYLASIAQCPLYVVHVTIAEGVDIIARAIAEGKDVIGETCPQYLTHNHDNLTALMNQKPVFTVVNPPIRAKEDNERLWQGIRDGTITVVASDTAPNKAALKDVGMWSEGFVPMGLGANSALILPVLLSEGVNKRGLPLERVVEVTAYNPARYFGLYPAKGTIEVGSDADIVVVDLDREVTWRPELSPSNVDWSIYDGWHFKGLPVLTIARGRVVMEERRVVGKPGDGKYIARKIRQI
ncbi:MAG: amidohydrolase family protein [Chloroflexi bacterium]|nr:amidohydrolase family protein [Chloroflexota bacterium]